MLSGSTEETTEFLRREGNVWAVEGEIIRPRRQSSKVRGLLLRKCLARVPQSFGFFGFLDAKPLGDLGNDL